MRNVRIEQRILTTCCSGRRPTASEPERYALELLDLIAEDPCRKPPPYEKLVGDLSGACSRRINIQHRLVYQIPETGKTLKILRLRKHYE